MVLVVIFSLRFTYSSTECSDRKLPAVIEMASTKISTTPVSKMVDFGTSATAIPDNSPTVETKLSSTPKIKFLKYEIYLSGVGQGGNLKYEIDENL